MADENNNNQVSLDDTANVSSYRLGDFTYKYVDAQSLAILDQKVDKDGAKVLSDVNFSTEYRDKLTGIQAGAQVNPTIDSTLDTTSDNPVKNSAIATAIDALTTNINNFKETPATENTFGVFKVGNNLSMSAGGVLSANTYSLTPASSSLLGGIKIGETLVATNDGVANVKVASPITLGGVKIDGGGLDLDQDDVLFVDMGLNGLNNVSVVSPIDGQFLRYDDSNNGWVADDLPIAGSSTIGGVKISGGGMLIDQYGYLSVDINNTLNINNNKIGLDWGYVTNYEKVYTPSSYITKDTKKYSLILSGTKESEYYTYTGNLFIANGCSLSGMFDENDNLITDATQKWIAIMKSVTQSSSSTWQAHIDLYNIGYNDNDNIAKIIFNLDFISIGRSIPKT